MSMKNKDHIEKLEEEFMEEEKIEKQSKGTYKIE